MKKDLLARANWLFEQIEQLTLDACAIDDILDDSNFVKRETYIEISTNSNGLGEKPIRVDIEKNDYFDTLKLIRKMISDRIIKYSDEFRKI